MQLCSRKIFSFIIGLLWCLENDEHVDDESATEDLAEKEDDSKNTTINDLLKKCLSELEENLRYRFFSHDLHT